MDNHHQTTGEDAPTPVVHDDVIALMITRALGEELKRTREDSGLSQAQLAARMPSKIHVKTVATYEQGTRPCSVVRLCEIARALGASPADILARALHRAGLDAQNIRLHVDLRVLIDDPRPELQSLRQWARARLATYRAITLARLDGNSIQEMALFLEVTPSDLISQLAAFVPNTTAVQGAR